MDIGMIWNEVKGTEKAIASKSDAHRALIAAAMSDTETVFNLTKVSLDIDATISCLEALGAKIFRSATSLTVTPIKGKAIAPVLDCNESGSTLRFMIPVATVMSSSPAFKGRGRLSARPLSPLKTAMEANGASFSSSTLPLSITGTLKGGVYTLPGNVSSQFISGLLFALPNLENDSEIKLSTALESSSYVDMTVQTLAEFGIKIQKTKNGYFIPGNQKYISPKTYTVEGDWSNIAPFMAAAALGGEIEAQNLKSNSKQSDRQIIDILQQFGADISQKENTYIVRKKNANPISVDMAQCPDLFPVLAVLACGAIGKSILYNAKRLRLKESDRIDSTMSLINALGGRAVADEDSLTVFGAGRLMGGESSSFNDHRIVMAGAVASAICKNNVIIKEAEAINKSFPDFIKHFEKTGGISRVI